MLLNIWLIGIIIILFISNLRLRSKVRFEQKCYDDMCKINDECLEFNRRLINGYVTDYGKKDTLPFDRVKGEYQKKEGNVIKFPIGNKNETNY